MAVGHHGVDPGHRHTASTSDRVSLQLSNAMYEVQRAIETLTARIEQQGPAAISGLEARRLPPRNRSANSPRA